MKVEIIDACQVCLLPRLPHLDDQSQRIVIDCFMRSEERWIGAVDGKIACVWGLIPPTLLSDIAYLWLYNNELVTQHKFAFVRHSQIQMERMLKLYPNIIGDCVYNNTTARRWLEWLGAKFGIAS